MNKYAYLIIANRNPNQLQQLINTLDDSRNDIYLLVDKKSRIFPKKFEVKYSSIFYLSPINIYWGGYSQIQAELNLFRISSKKHYKYYFLLSGLDLPLVNQNKIHVFFDNHPDKEFISYFPITPYRLNNINMRLKPHLFKKHLLSTSYIFKLFQRIYRKLLKIIPQTSIDLKNLVYGSQWITIDDDLVQYIIKHEKWIYNHFHQGILVDELFIPILINNNKHFSNKIYKNNLRYIKFVGASSHPHVWKYSDINVLKYAVTKGYLFSRKFDERVDSRIIRKIVRDVTL